MKVFWVDFDTPQNGIEPFCWNGYGIVADNDCSRSAEELAAAYPSLALEICAACGASDDYRLAVADALARAAGTVPTATERPLTDDEAARVVRLVPLLAALCDVSRENVRVTVSVDRDGDSWLVQTRHGGEWRRARVHERKAITDGDDDMLSTVESRAARWATELRKTMRDELRWEKLKYERLLARADAIDAGIEKASGR